MADAAIDALIEKLEAATCAQYALDVAIYEAIGRAEPEIPPAYTASMDAALTLVPDGYDWRVDRINSGLTIFASVGNEDVHFGDTPAIALCIAALRARKGGEG